ncbi:MAG TPA: hypothetical protein VI136_10415, partial [Verrucomicrobiae bacterium]
FGLSAPFDGLARPFLHLVLGLPFQMTQIVISGQDKLVQRSFQGAGGRRRQYGQGLGVGFRNQGGS